MAQCSQCGYWLGHQAGCQGSSLIVYATSTSEDKWPDRYYAAVKERDAIDARLVSLQCRVETLFDAIKPWFSSERQLSELKAKIEEHFK